MSEQIKLEFLCVHQGMSIVGLLKVEDEVGRRKAEDAGFSVTKMVPESSVLKGDAS